MPQVLQDKVMQEVLRLEYIIPNMMYMVMYMVLAVGVVLAVQVVIHTITVVIIALEGMEVTELFQV